MFGFHRYALSRRDGLTRFIDDGRIEIGSTTVERSIRPIALNRKNALFAGSDAGAEHWATIASLIGTAKRHWPVAQTSSPGSLTIIQIARSTTCCLGPMPQSTNSKPWPENSALMSFVNTLGTRTPSLSRTGLS